MMKFACSLLFKARGWKFINKVPADLRSFVFIGAPHTSNIDFFPAMAVSYLMGRQARFVIKSEWLKFPMGLLLKPAGAVGIDRSLLKETDRKSNVELMADLFKIYPELVLMIAPEGTRSANPTWKTGFYYVAQKANVPIVCGYADYEKKEAGVGLVIYPTDFEKDMRTIMNFYAGVKGKRPDKFKIDERYSGQ